MPTKPSSDTILSTYSLEELLELVKEKSEQNANEQIEEFKHQINQFASSTLGTSQTKSSTASQPKESRPKAKSTTTKKSVKKSKSTSSSKSSRKSSGKSLSSMILNILNESSSPMKVDDLQKALKKKKWTTKSSKPRQIIQLELMKLIKKDQIKRADRGMYEMA